MHIDTVWIRNFRRLKDARIDLASDISIFVGSNNSGKTSAGHALQLFTAASRDRFSLHDFSSDCWDDINAFGEGAEGSELPSISIDIWLRVGAIDLHRVVDLLPSLTWEGTRVGIRVEFAAIDAPALRTSFQEARNRARRAPAPPNQANALQQVVPCPQAAEAVPEQRQANGEYLPQPRTLCDYLADSIGDHLRRSFELRYYVLDSAQFGPDFRPAAGYTPLRMTHDKGRGSREILSSLIKVDFLHAQRHLSDSGGGARSEDLSRCLSRFYERNLEKHEEDYDAQRALYQSEALLNDHLERVFGPTLERLSHLGYPGLNNPKLLIKTALNPATILSSHDGARVHYAVGPEVGIDTQTTLPDRYNGLGFKNLIYMVVELLDAHARWLDIEENRPPLHLIFIEEPEAHLHAQLQQVFIRKVLDILDIPDEDAPHCTTQIVVSTHSPHVLFERGFQPIRYFRRVREAGVQRSEVLSMASFYETANDPNDPTDRTRDFLERYLRLTHCDLFFADAAILVEGNVERLLMPQMIAKVAPGLLSTYVSILEVGGAFGHRFKGLIEFLGLTTLIVTDIDSVMAPAAADPVAPDDEDDPDADPDLEEAAEDRAAVRGGRKACMANEPGALTSNQTLIQWLPGRSTIADLLNATVEQRIQARTVASDALIRVSYQTSVNASWRGTTAAMVGRTLEEAFALENLAWCQDAARAEIRLRVRGCNKLSLEQIAQSLHRKIKSANFRKTDFALALLSQDPSAWTVPAYISEGLLWLEHEVVPHPPEIAAPPINAGAVA
ncbi:ATP-dependent nuclease [Burkholderia pseudomallei]|nr:ATP-dependent endonuclease [Burkholderia pseudomallei]AJX95108.1 AAA domain protein [Burkholderia pseudomallei PB08298010]MBF3420647.1 ATP-dependent endonuclease [Burkholderia pseudomallei]MCQ8216294.1 ATP-dependent endonuclease [Burkholderia pseudomallei]MDA5594225.1 ATP-dependent endonuclease [Burkholderia pseudomallei]QTB55415.1 ATP-dependent endonuclease [Burkholderia pseudomallei]